MLKRIAAMEGLRAYLAIPLALKLPAFALATIYC